MSFLIALLLQVGHYNGMQDQSNLTIPALLARTVAQYADEPALGFILDGQLDWRRRAKWPTRRRD